MFLVMKNETYFDNIVVVKDNGFCSHELYHILFRNFSTQHQQYNISYNVVHNFPDICRLITLSDIISKNKIIMYFKEDLYIMSIKEFVQSQQELNPEQFL